MGIEVIVVRFANVHHPDLFGFWKMNFNQILIILVIPVIGMPKRKA
jgi:hypothetical protein